MIYRHMKQAKLTRQIVSFVFLCLAVAEILIFIPSASHFQYRWFETQWQHFLVQFDKQSESDITTLQASYQAQARQSAITFHTPEFVCWSDDGAHITAIGEKPEIITSLDLADYHLRHIFMAISIISGGGPDTVMVFDSRQDSLFKASWSTSLIRAELQNYALRILGLTFVIGLIIIAPLYYFLSAKFVKPLRVMTKHMEEFAADPSQLREPINLNHISGEISEIGAALSAMTEDVRRALRHQERLADIGEATAKINHDLRNILMSATLVTDILMASDDPKIQRVAPHIERAISDAASMTQNMMDYLSEPQTESPSDFTLSDMVENLSHDTKLKVKLHGADALHGTPAIFYRLLLNLARNARAAQAQTLTIDIWRAGHFAVIDISDDGPGIAPELKAHIFSAFYSGRKSTTGLGLAIAKDLAIAMGGDLRLSRSSAHGSEFRLSVPHSWITDASSSQTAS